MQQQRDLVDVLHIHGGKDGLWGHVGEQRDLGALLPGQGTVAAADENVGLDADGAQFLDGMLGGLGLELACSSHVGQQGQVDEQSAFPSKLDAQLADGLQKGQ